MVFRREDPRLSPPEISAYDYRYLGAYEYICSEGGRPVRFQLGEASSIEDIIERDIFKNLANPKSQLIGKTIKQRLMFGIIQDLQTLGPEHMESPDSLGLKNVWEEICVRVQCGDECCFHLRDPKELEELEANDITPESYGLQDASEAHFWRPMQFARTRIEALSSGATLTLWVYAKVQSSMWSDSDYDDLDLPPGENRLKEELALFCWDWLVNSAEDFRNERVESCSGMTSYIVEEHMWDGNSLGDR